MILAIELGFFALSLFVLWVYACMLIGEFKGAPFVATSKKNEMEIWKRVKLKKGATFIDVGSGDGRMVMAAVKLFGVKGVGIELQPVLVWWSKLISKIIKIQNTVFVCEDFWKSDLGKADYIYFYLGPKTVENLARKIEKEDRKEQIIISRAFEIKSWKNKVIDRWETRNGRVWVYEYHPLTSSS